MFKLPRLLVAPTLCLALSLSLFSASAFAQSADQDTGGSVIHHATTQPNSTNHSHDGPSPIDMGGGDDGHGNGGGYGGNGGYGNGGYGNGGYGGYGNGGYGNGGYGGYGNGGYGNGGYNGYGNGGYGNGGYGDGGYNGYGNGGFDSNGYASRYNHYCARHHCGNGGRTRRCVRVTGQVNSHLTNEPQSYLACKWVKAGHQ